jgi:hypothetical protein
MQERSKSMKARIEQLEKEDEALRDREKESQNIYYLLKTI